MVDVCLKLLSLCTLSIVKHEISVWLQWQTKNNFFTLTAMKCSYKQISDTVLRFSGLKS